MSWDKMWGRRDKFWPKWRKVKATPPIVPNVATVFHKDWNDEIGPTCLMRQFKVVLSPLRESIYHFLKPESFHDIFCSNVCMTFRKWPGSLWHPVLQICQVVYYKTESELTCDIVCQQKFERGKVLGMSDAISLYKALWATLALVSLYICGFHSHYNLVE